MSSKEGSSEVRAPPPKPVKQQIRSLKRMLNSTKLNLPADQRASIEKKLAELRETLVNQTEANNERRFARKYKNILRDEKKKVASMLRRASEMENTQERIEALRHAEDLMNYITYYPKDKGYISLFKNWDPEDPQYEGQQRALEKRRNETMAQIKEKLLRIAIENMHTDNSLDAGVTAQIDPDAIGANLGVANTDSNNSGDNGDDDDEDQEGEENDDEGEDDEDDMNEDSDKV
eukprot:CAMPEP_0170177078 /NCGR_PEP_ID=MMETSP0040_2-20121228/9809_1 /TAXON_ID=641309 /ORGANISM="Lotharella oceanica, Strain CCMP622" /LENGTH=232 /DNA_ID=CAMNT_0010419595 /DNA_START=128 /DNA_END=826 /DNA_ORIENTATION=+